MKYKMVKFERLYRAYRDADAKAFNETDCNEADWRCKHTIEEMKQIYKSVDDAWDIMIVEIKQQAARNNPYAQNILSAVDDNEPVTFLIAVDAYWNVITRR